jgi:peptidoglycan/xylan/chitin deacetylase (PgdA/CDA1 family)
VTSPSGVVPVLLYHRIADVPDDPFAVSPQAFAEQAEAIAASGRTPLTISQLADLVRRRARRPDRCVAITFDDGYAETLDAVAVLRAHGLCATVYLTAGWLGASGMLSVEQVVGLRDRAEVEVGAHSVTHPHLDELRRPQIEAEVTESRAALQALGVTVRSFAYPHGAYDATVRSVVVETGYGSAVAVKNALSHWRDDPWAIARYTVGRSTTTEQVLRLLEGRGAPLAWQHERWRTRGWRLVRQVRQRVREHGGLKAA